MCPGAEELTGEACGAPCIGTISGRHADTYEGDRGQGQTRLVPSLDYSEMAP